MVEISKRCTFIFIFSTPVIKTKKINTNCNNLTVMRGVEIYMENQPTKYKIIAEISQTLSQRSIVELYSTRVTLFTISAKILW